MKIRCAPLTLRDLDAIGDATERESFATVAARIFTTILDCVDLRAVFHGARRLPETFG
jgi:plasmid stabilization system protein ParE